MDGKDRNGFQLEKLGELEVSMLCPQKSPKKIIIVFFPMEFVLYLLHNATDVAWLAQLGERRSAEQDITG